LVRVLTEIGRGRITETFIKDKHVWVHGETDGRHIKINPAVATCDTLIHETLHVLEPHWSESYVRRTTTFLLRRMSDEQVQQLFESYNEIAKRRRKRGRRISTSQRGLVGDAEQRTDVPEVPRDAADGDGDGLPRDPSVL
jgi:hypothetical protein